MLPLLPAGGWHMTFTVVMVGSSTYNTFVVSVEPCILHFLST